MTVDRATGISDWRHRVALTSGLLLAPFAAMLHLEVAYADVRHACRQASELRLQLETLLLLLVALAGAAIAALVYRRAGGEERAVAEDSRDDAPTPGSRDRFLGAMGLVLGVLFALVIVAQWLAVIQLDPCQ